MQIENYYKAVQNGEQIDKKEILSYLSSFDTVILWGAGNLGTELGSILLNNHIEIIEYWDMKAEQMKECNRIEVRLPFYRQYNPETTVIVACIVNGSLGDEWTKDTIVQNGYQNYIKGMELYEGIGCLLTKENFDIQTCIQTKACSLCNCIRYTNLVQNEIDNTKQRLTYQLLTFIISGKCTLKCKYCGQRLTQYAPEAIRDFSKDNIIRDINHTLDAIDFIGMISIIGGEPFLHPQLNDIVEHLLKKTNFGVINITTNGIFKVPIETIQRLKHARIKISFSVYDQFLNKAQKMILENNINTMEEQGVNYSLAHPLWVKPQEMKPYLYNEEAMKQCKMQCESTKMSAAVKDGKFIPCSIVENIDGLQLYDLKDDVVDVTDKNKLKERLLESRMREFYEACRYCGHQKAEEIPAGEQVSEAKYV